MKQRRRQVPEIAVEGRDVRRAPFGVGHAGQIAVGEPVHLGARENELAIAPQMTARRPGQVERAEDEIRGGERVTHVHPVPVAQAQQRDDRELRPRRLAADRPVAGIALEQPERGVLAVVGASRIRILRSQAVVDADHREARRVGGGLEPGILEVGCTEHPAAAMEMQIHAVRLALRLDDPQPDVTGTAGDVLPARLGQEHRRREDVATLAPLASRHRGRHREDGRQGGEQALEALVEAPRLGEHLLVVHALTVRAAQADARRSRGSASSAAKAGSRRRSSSRRQRRPERRQGSRNTSSEPSTPRRARSGSGRARRFRAARMPSCASISIP